MTPPGVPAPDAPARPVVAALLVILVVGGALAVRLAVAAVPSPQVVQIAGYATGLNDRSDGQRYNARLAAEALNGRVIPPGAIFSFNHAVKPWTIEQGYVKAPVSFDGELVLAYGGGICQTSTTLYNAALLAGLPILERHPHVFAPHYVVPGRDAAVAQYTVDLRFQNPYPWPIRIDAWVRGDRIEVRLVGPERPDVSTVVTTDVISVTAPAHRIRSVAADEPMRPAVFRTPGATGFRVVTTRILYRAGHELRRERLSDDTYQAEDRVLLLPDDVAP